MFCTCGISLQRAEGLPLAVTEKMRGCITCPGWGSSKRSCLQSLAKYHCVDQSFSTQAAAAGMHEAALACRTCCLPWRRPRRQNESRRIRQCMKQFSPAEPVACRCAGRCDRTSADTRPAGNKACRDSHLPAKATVLPSRACREAARRPAAAAANRNGGSTAPPLSPACRSHHPQAPGQYCPDD